MKRLLTLALTVVLANVAILSKAASGEIEKKAKAQTSKMTQQLSLSKEQQDKIYAIAVDFLTQKEKITTSGKSEGENTRQISQLEKQAETKIEAVLTAEQAAKWKQNRAQNAQKREDSKKTK